MTKRTSPPTQQEREARYQGLLEAAEDAQTLLFAHIETIPDTALQDQIFAALMAQQEAQELIAALGDADRDFIEFARTWTVLRYGNQDDTVGKGLH